MKNLKFFTLAIAILGFTATSFAQNTATTTATASANILQHLTIVNAGNLNFGNIIASNALGTVKVIPAGTRTATDGAALPTGVAGTVSAAAFTVTGEEDATYAVTLPTAPVTITDGTNNMTVTAFESNSTNVLTGGTQTFQVGGTLNVAASQAAGAYTGTFSVTVAYN